MDANSSERQRTRSLAPHARPRPFILSKRAPISVFLIASNHVSTNGPFLSARSDEGKQQPRCVAVVRVGCWRQSQRHVLFFDTWISRAPLHPCSVEGTDDGVSTTQQQCRIPTAYREQDGLAGAPFLSHPHGMGAGRRRRVPATGKPQRARPEKGQSRGTSVFTRATPLDETPFRSLETQLIDCLDASIHLIGVCRVFCLFKNMFMQLINTYALYYKLILVSFSFSFLATL